MEADGSNQEGIQIIHGWPCFLFIYLFSVFIYFWLCWIFVAACGLSFSSCGEQGLLFIAVHGLLIVVASLVVEHGL